MKTKWIVIFGLILVVGVLIFLNEKGIIHWQALTILAAALLAPFKLVASFFDSDKEKIDKINKEHEAVRAREKKYQQDIENKLKASDQQIEQLNKNKEALDNKMKTLEEQVNAVNENVKKMSVKGKEDEGRELLGG